MNKNWNLIGGVIMLGSLLWQDHLHNTKNDNIRKQWREKALANDRIIAKLPIRYGRYSNGGIYTMVFSNNCQRYKRLGTGYISLFKSNPINDFNKLLSEAKAMSIAEGMNGNFWGVSGNGDIWGKMGILFNDLKIDKKIKRIILNGWEKQFLINNGTLNSYDFKFIKNERTCITNKGKLNIKWIEPVDKRDSRSVSEFDFLIATATKPKHETNTIMRYPNIQEIVTSVKKDNKRYYFIQNMKSGITTFQDNEILNRL